jgi:RNA-directed DNA polymerase
MKQMAARYRLLAVLAAGVLLLVAGASSRCPTTGRSSAVRGQRLRGRGNKLRNDRWVFGDPASDAYLVKVSWTDIVRHVMVTGAASPVDPALADYWAERRRKVKPPLDNYTLRLLARQDARCPLRRDHLVSAGQPPQSPNDWEQWWQ